METICFPIKVHFSIWILTGYMNKLRESEIYEYQKCDRQMKTFKNTWRIKKVRKESLRKNSGLIEDYVYVFCFFFCIFIS